MFLVASSNTLPALSTPLTPTLMQPSSCFSCLEVGFVDTTNKLFTQKLESGDLFVFPKGLIHYQYDSDASVPALAVSAFGSASAGTVSLPGTGFNTSNPDLILAKSFKTDIATIQKLKTGFVHSIELE